MKIHLNFDFEPHEAEKVKQLMVFIKDIDAIEEAQHADEILEAGQQLQDHTKELKGSLGVDPTQTVAKQPEALYIGEPNRAQTIEPDHLAGMDGPEPPAQEKEYTFEEMRAACVEFRKVHGKEVMAAVFKQFGAAKFKDVKPEEYPQLMEALNA